MLRRVDFAKAIFGGIVGALAWELVARLLSLFIPAFDVVKMVGTMVCPPDKPQFWWPVGFAAHASIGAIWAVFYAYFFWSVWKVHPIFQALAFSLLPAVLAGVVMIPQLGFMHPLVLAGKLPAPGIFAWNYGWGAPVEIILGHIVYGVVLGAIYRRPVGHSVKKELANA